MFVCNNCGTVFDSDDLMEADGKCPDCRSEDVEKADECMLCCDPVAESQIKELNGMKLCPDCYEAESKKA